ncbi:MAG TPA: tyrosine-protein phosphatase, partial [Chloroflexota bacterium]|nr:tyrosine-protein phosphatase [Chloroflexota bacterium]
AQPRMQEIFSLLGEPDALPAVVHCTAGKDRTGIVVALLLGLAGVPVETIAADYALTAQYLTDDFYRGLRAQAGMTDALWASMQPFLLCDEQFLHQTWVYLDGRYGGPRRYLETAGVPAARLDALRRALTEDPQA